MNSRRPQFHSIPLRTRAQVPVQASMSVQTQQKPASRKSYVSSASMPVMPDDTSLYQPAHIGNSSIRYRTTEEEKVFQQGNKRVVVRHAKQRHGLLYVGFTMLAMLALYTLLNWASSTWQAHQLDATYSFPRYWQTDQVLGIDHDSSSHPSHLIFQNFYGDIVFIVIPAGDISQAKIYNVTSLFGPNASEVPVTATFQDVNHDGKLDILIHLGDQTIVFLNTGTVFQPEQ